MSSQSGYTRARRRQLNRKNCVRDLTSRKGDLFSETREFIGRAKRQAATEQIREWRAR